jgi:alpha-beta hydrolase superfamily lysophospholipase
LTLPKGASRTKPVGAIVTVTGSGAQDRDENIGLQGFRPFRQLADALARRGIAVLRMDDRGTGASGGTFKGSTSADFAEDVRAGLAYLRTRPEIRADRLGVLGHSEGACDRADGGRKGAHACAPSCCSPASRSPGAARSTSSSRTN